ncbi:phage integrase Arm DNA-binding domain-containing protein [Rahnella aquatilis]|uniref:phage integrase Arm DNA-binding domain-containing protein n=1 Tax=Rahnella aquatilis TaxID=34038 RepID=UPI00365B292C
MAARPRKYNISTPNLYCKLDKRNNKTYWQYRHPITGEFIGFGTDSDAAHAAALEMNRITSEQLTSQSFALIDIAKQRTEPNAQNMRLKQWIKEYKSILERRVQRKELASSTARGRKACAELLSARSQNILLKEVGAREMAALINEYVDANKTRMAQVMRATWIDMFKEAQFAGEVPPGFNPALATRKPLDEVSRQRLTLDDWWAIYHEAERRSPYICNAMLLAVVTGQRRGDIVKMKFSDIWDDMLHVVQGKGKGKIRIAIPLSLRCDAINMSVRDVINKCRDRVLSKHLVHNSTVVGGSALGSPVAEGSLTQRFAEARDCAKIKIEKGKTPPTFHEQRSLSERLYKAQGINTQELLGHSSAKMTELYHDERKEKWVVIAV